MALMLNPSALVPSLPKSNPARRKRRKKNPNADQYTKAAGKVFGPPIVFAGGGALAGLVIASVARPEKIRYAAGIGAILGLVTMGVLATDALAHHSRG